MIPRIGVAFWICCWTIRVGLGADVGNRFTHLDDPVDPIYPGLEFSKLVTPQWVGESGVDAVVVLAIDDMREAGKYEAYLRPIIERLRQIDGRAPVSIMANALDPSAPEHARWLGEGVSIEVHTLAHPCPLLAGGNFEAASRTYHDGVALLNRVPGNRAVAFRMPCCDSMNSPSPRFYAEIFSRTNAHGEFLTLDSSIMNIPTSADPGLERQWVLTSDGKERFRELIPFPSFATTIENYPYPFVIGGNCWEFPATAPSDWEAQNLRGKNAPETVEDFKRALDITVAKQGVYNLIFHPHGWIRNDQIVELIDDAVARHGKRVKFLNFREAQEALDAHLLGGEPLRAANGGDNGVRLLDLNDDGYLDVVIGNERRRQTRIWDPVERAWKLGDFPARLTIGGMDAGVRFGVVSGRPVALALSGGTRRAWRFEATWIEAPELVAGLEIEGRGLRAVEEGLDLGVRLRDFDQDGQCELLVSHPGQQQIFQWSSQNQEWRKADFAWPDGVRWVDAEGRDAGLRFADLNGDGFKDMVFSNAERYGVYLYTPVPQPHLGWNRGWSQAVRTGERGNAGALPMISRGGSHPNNGAWFRNGRIWFQNEDSAHLPDKVDRRTFEELIAYDMPQPRSPSEALADFEVWPGFEIACVAAEPLIQDPVAFEWDGHGRLWVAEMIDYPVGVGAEPGGVVRVLEDENGDGIYDKATTFAEGLNFPSGVMPWRKGAYVSAAPDILWCEDTDGDGRADVRRVVFTGFGQGNQQHRVNGFEYGLDHWIYGANGDSDGRIRSADGPVTDLRGRDFRFHPETGQFETVAGRTQFGRRRDDWGNWFGNNNPNWGWHYHLPEHYLRRNPAVAARTLKVQLAQYPDAVRVRSISRAMQRFNWPELANILTSACSPAPYRDEQFGEEFEGALFVSEPANNLVHCELLSPQGVSFASRKLGGADAPEFLASKDNWFRPAMLKTGPGGALYIADMYRLVIEHIAYGLPGMEKQIDLRAGSDLGRIYRVQRRDRIVRPRTKLGGSDADLAEALRSANGWERDLAQQQILQRENFKETALVRAVAAEGGPRSRLQALWVLAGLKTVTGDDLICAWSDPDPRVRAGAVQVFESALQEKEIEALLLQPAVFEGLAALAQDPEMKVRYQVALTLGDVGGSEASQALAEIARRDSADPEMRIAVLSSAPRHMKALLSALSGSEEHGELFGALCGTAVQLQMEGATVLEALAGDPREPGALAKWNGLWNALDRQGLSLDAMMRQAAVNAELRHRVKAFLAAARTMADDEAAVQVRVAASAFLGRSTEEMEEDVKRLAGFVRSLERRELREAALKRLGQMRVRLVAEELVRHWQPLSPLAKNEVLGILASRRDWAEVLVQAIAEGTVPGAQVPLEVRQRLAAHGEARIARQAQALFEDLDRSRVSIEEQAAGLLQIKGDAGRGKELFVQHCAVCHRYGSEGQVVGPDLETVAAKGKALLLAGILDPNRAVEAPYVSYMILTKDGRDLSGIIVSETENHVGLKSGDGREELLLRSEIAQMITSGLSLMPEGFGEALAGQQMADLLEFLAPRR